MREPSLAELAEDMAELKHSINDFLKGWPNQLEELRKTFVNRELYEARHLFLQERTAKLEQKETSQDEAIKRLEDGIDARFSRLWTALVAGLLFPIIVAVVVIIVTKGLGA